MIRYGLQPVDDGFVGDHKHRHGEDGGFAVFFRAEITGQHERSPQQGHPAGIIRQRFRMQLFGKDQLHGIVVFPFAIQLGIRSWQRVLFDGFAIDANGKAIARPCRMPQR